MCLCVRVFVCARVFVCVCQIPRWSSLHQLLWWALEDGENRRAASRLRWASFTFRYHLLVIWMQHVSVSHATPPGINRKKISPPLPNAWSRPWSLMWGSVAVRMLMYCIYTEQNYKCNTFIVASLRHTCAIIMLSNQYLDMPHLWGGWIILAKEKCSLTQI